MIYGFASRRYDIVAGLVGVAFWGAFASGMLDPTISPLVAVVGLLAVVILFVFFGNYYNWLSSARDTIIAMRDKISERRTSSTLKNALGFPSG